MKFTQKLIALMLSALMVIGFIPTLSAETVRLTEKPVHLTEAERKAKLKELDEWSDKLYKMTQQYGVKPTKKAAENDPYALARIIVKSARKLDYKGSVAHINGHNDLHIIQYKTPAEARKAVGRYSRMRGVEYAEPDIIVHICQEPHVNEFMSWGLDSYYVNAFDYGEHILETHGNDVGNLPEVVVGVIDTGIDYNHPYFGGMAADGGRIKEGGKNFVNNNMNPQDDQGHGSHVSGTICDATFSNVKILPIKVLGADGSGNMTVINNGMEYAYLQGCQVANMSLGGQGSASSAKTVIDKGTDQGTVYCVAAGNSSADASGFTPASVERAFTVAAYDPRKTMAYFSNYGKVVDISAPGFNINSVRLGGGIVTYSGTSMASPHAAAACALLKTNNFNMTPDQIMDWLKTNAEPATFPAGKPGGTGLLRLAVPQVTPPQSVDGKTGFYFETHPENEGWTFQDSDGDGHNWGWRKQLYQVGSPILNIPEGSGCAYSASYYKEPGSDNAIKLTPDNWLISPEVPGGGYVSFMLAAQDPKAPNEPVGVYASADGGNTWSDELGYFVATALVETHIVKLDAYTGKNIKLAFRHYNVTDQFQVNLDAVIVAEAGVPEPPPETEEIWELADTIKADEEYIIVASGKNFAVCNNGPIAAAPVTENADNTITVRSSVANKAKWTAGSGLTFKNGEQYLAINVLAIPKQALPFLPPTYTYESSLGTSVDPFNWTYANNDLKGIAKEGSENKTYYIGYDANASNFVLVTGTGNNLKFYQRPAITYTVTWKNYNGETLRTDQVRQGSTPVYTGETPVKDEPTEQEGYHWKFIGWEPEPAPIYGDTEYIAKFVEAPPEFTVTWKNWDGKVLETDKNVPRGTTPVYNGATPTKPTDENYIYTFDKWTPDIVPVTGDTTYTATFIRTPKPPVPEGKEVWKRVEQLVAGKTYLIVADNNLKALKNNNGTVAAADVTRSDTEDDLVFVDIAGIDALKWTAASGWNFKNGGSYLSVNVPFLGTPSLVIGTGAAAWTYANHDLSTEVSGWISNTIYYLTCSGANFTIGTTANQNIRFYEKAYVASYIDGEERITTEYYTEGEQFSVHAAPPDKENEAFTGWKCDKDQLLYQPGDHCTMPAANITFTAQWEESTPTIEVWQLTDTLVDGETYIIVAGGKGKAVSNEYALNGKNFKPVGVTENSDYTLTVPDTADLSKITWKAESGSSGFSFQSVGNNKYIGLTGFYIFYAVALTDTPQYWTYDGNDLATSKGVSGPRYLAYKETGNYFIISNTTGNNIKFYHKVAVPVS